jgi:hypothetical protein
VTDYANAYLSRSSLSRLMINIDLNLLRVFDILFDECNVTRAGNRTSCRRRFRFIDFRAPRFPYLSPLAREGADGQAVVCPLLRGSSPTSWVAPKQHRRTRRLLTNRPCSSLVYEESDSKERLRVSNWIVQRLYNMQSRKPSNSDF